MKVRRREDGHGWKAREASLVDVDPVLLPPPTAAARKSDEVRHRGAAGEHPAPVLGKLEQVEQPANRDVLQLRAEWGAHGREGVLVEQRGQPVRGQGCRGRPPGDEMEEARAGGARRHIAARDELSERDQRAVPVFGKPAAEALLAGDKHRGLVDARQVALRLVDRESERVSLLVAPLERVGHIFEPTLRAVQETLSVPNTVAAELASIGDGVLEHLRDRLRVAIHLRGNQLTIEGEDDRVGQVRTVIDEIVELVEGGHDIGPSTVDAVLGAMDQGEDVREVFDDVVWRHRGKRIAPKTVMQKRYVDAIRRHTVTFGIGPAGTGKTYLAMALAVAALQERQVSRIILTRPAVEAGERLGFLPGDLLAKVDPYLRPLYDALYDMLEADKLNSYMERGIVEVAPLAFMRGRTLNDSFIILDEAQNTSPEQMQMFLTRLGFGSKVVVTGDVTQVDLPKEQASGLIQVHDILGTIDGIAFIQFGHEDVVRHKLVQRIVEAYKSHAEETGTARRR